MGLFSRGPNPDPERRSSFEHAPEPVDTPSVQEGAETAPERTVEPVSVEPAAPTVTEPPPEPVRPFAPIAESIPEPVDDEDLRITASEAIKPIRMKAEEPAADVPETKRAKV